MSLVDVFDVPMDYQPLPNGTGVPIYSEATRVQAQFIPVHELNERASLMKGEEVWESYEVILLKPHRDTTIVAHRANDQHRKQYPAQYERFKRGEMGELGTPLDKLYGITAKQIAQLRHHEVFTVEQAAQSDVYPDIQAKAKIFLNSRKGLLDAEVAAKEVQILRVEVREKDEELERLRAEVLALKSKPKKKKVESCEN